MAEQTDLLFTRWFYPLLKPIQLCDDPIIQLDNPREHEVDEVAELISEQYSREPVGLFPPLLKRATSLSSGF